MDATGLARATSLAVYFIVQLAFWLVQPPPRCPKDFIEQHRQQISEDADLGATQLEFIVDERK